MIWSFSRLDSFHSCKAGWYQNYVLKKPQSENGYSAHGSFCHDLMEKHAKGEITQGEALELFESGWYEVEPDLPKFFINLKDNYYKKIHSFFNRKELLIGETVSVEDDLTVELPSGAKLRGKLDRVYKDDGIVISDYKISTPFTNEKIKHKRLQLDLYAYIFFKEYGEYPDKIGWIYFKDFSKNKFIPFNRKKMEDAVDWAENTIRSINGRLVAMERLGAKGLFMPENDKLLKSDGTRDRFCNELCGYKENCPFVDGNHLKMMKPPKNQEFNLNLYN